jgi:hypothetical protein
LAITETGLKLIAAAAIMGLSRINLVVELPGIFILFVHR